MRTRLRNHLTTVAAILLCFVAAFQEARARESLQSCLVPTLKGLIQRPSQSQTLARIGTEWRHIPVEAARTVTAEPNAVVQFYRKSGPEVSIVVFGKLENVEIVPNYKVLRITDPQGRMHFIDPEMVEIKSVLSGPERIDASLHTELKNLNGRTSAVLDESRLKSHLCAEYSTRSKSPQINQLKAIVEKNFRKQQWSHDPALRTMRCMGGMAMVPLLSAPYWSVKDATERGSWIHDYGSNYWYSIVDMAALEQCLKALAPDHRNVVLLATLGASVMGNIWEEVDLHPYVENRSLPIFNSRGNRVKTDVDDLKAGILGSLTYLVGVKMLESHFSGFSMTRYCR